VFRDTLCLEYGISYEEAVRALSEQQGVIDSFRTRAGLLLSTAAITTSFLGAQALDGGATPIVWLAMAGFVGVATVSLGILWPRRWEFNVDPREVVEAYIEADHLTPIGELHRDLSLQMYGSYVENRQGLGQLAVLVQFATSLLTIDVILWITAIAGTA
jgi:hypothetical protein